MTTCPSSSMMNLIVTSREIPNDTDFWSVLSICSLSLGHVNSTTANLSKCSNDLNTTHCHYIKLFKTKSKCK